jgi:hypothetical protein
MIPEFPGRIIHRAGPMETVSTLIMSDVGDGREILGNQIPKVEIASL